MSLQDTRQKAIDYVNAPARLFEKEPKTDPEHRRLEAVETIAEILDHNQVDPQVSKDRRRMKWKWTMMRLRGMILMQ